MGVLAADLGIGRATLHRLIGDRNQLLSEIMWAALLSTLESAPTAPDHGLNLALDPTRSFPPRSRIIALTSERA